MWELILAGAVAAALTQYLRVYIGQLRDKLQAETGELQLIQTEAGVGYRLRTD